METYCVSCQRNTADENSNVRKTGQYTLREKFSRGFIFASHFFFYISSGFNFSNWLPVDFSRGFIFANLSFINVLHIFIFSWFVLQLVVCESWSSYPNFSIFQIALFRYKIPNFRCNVQEEINRSTYYKKIYFFIFTYIVGYPVKYF